MKATFFRKLALGFSATLLFVYGIIYACGGDNGDWGVFFDTNFTPETFVDKSYTPLFLSSNLFYSPDSYDSFDTNHNKRFENQIITDWQVYVGNNSYDDAIKKIIVSDSSYIQLEKAKKIIKLDTKNQKIKKLLQFLDDAKLTSKTATDVWNYETTASYVTSKDIKYLEKKYNSQKDQFLKNRYWFQVIKGNFYSDKQQNTVAFFNKTEKEMPKNTLYYRAVAYLAGIEYKNKNFAKSNFLYAQVFDKCPEMRVVAAYCFHPQESADWNRSLEMTTTLDEKSALWALYGYYNDNKTAIENIFESNPKSEHLDFLLTRLINEHEQEADPYLENDDKLKFITKKDSLLAEDLKLISKIANSNQTKNPFLWKTACGYFETLHGNYDNADSYFNLAQANMPKTDLAIKQIRLLRFINNVSKIKTVNNENEKTIVDDLNWLYFEIPNEKETAFRYSNAINWSKTYLSTVFQNQNEAVMSELFLLNNDFYYNHKNLDAMKAFLKKTDKTPLETIAAKIYSLKLNDIYDFEAVKATYEDKIPEAIAFLEQTHSLHDDSFLGNPFNGNIKDCHDCDHVAYQKRKYSQLDFLKTIQTMKQNIEKKVDVYTNSLLIANGFYNITHFGNTRTFYESDMIGYGSSPYGFADKSKKLITNCALAKKYYSLALANASNKEQKAKCHYMLAKCERNDYYNKKYEPIKNYWEIDHDGIDFLAWSGFKNLKENYSKTKYYQEVISECGYFDTYINGLK
jgi:hypothetical protein